VTAVTVSGDCSRIAFVSDGQLYVSEKGGTRRLRAPAPAADPSFSTGKGDDLVFGAPRGVYLAKNATGPARLVAPGGWNPVYNDTKRKVLAYEVYEGWTTQIMYDEIGKSRWVISHDPASNAYGDGPSRDPVIGNSGYYVGFETEADNLWTTVSHHHTDRNKRPDVYLYTDVRHLTAVQSVLERGKALGGQNPSISFYANYVLFDAPAPFGEIFDAPPQIYMRYLGPV
jgi:hypothetical protein